MGNRDIRTVSLTSLRDHIAVVFQNPGLLYRSIAENLRIGKPDASDAELEAAARAAEAHQFVSVKPQRLCRDEWRSMAKSLSGGERQRLSIARAMLKDAPVLILDEATSALDNVTEARVQRALSTLVKGRTTFVIAHRLSTVRTADVILVLRDGRLVEQGRYDGARQTRRRVCGARRPGQVRGRCAGPCGGRVRAPLRRGLRLSGERANSERRLAGKLDGRGLSEKCHIAREGGPTPRGLCSAAGGL